MLRKLIYSIVALTLIVGFGVLITIAPYHIYTLTLTEGVNTRFLVMKPTNPVLYDGEEVKTPELKDMYDEGLYQTFHFAHFEIPLPINHPQFSLIPLIRIEGAGPRLGGSFQNEKNVEYFSFMIERPYKLETTYGDQKLFLLPIFKNYIDRKPSGEIWSDLFKKKLSLPSNEGESFFASLKTLVDVSYYDLVYNLYILYNRRFIIPEQATKFGHYDQQNLGIVRLPSEDVRVKIERLYVIDNGFIYPVFIKTRISEKSALNFRAKFLRDIKYKPSTTDSAISIYARYKQITYNQRLDQRGMSYLYSAWSHDLNNRDYVRVIVMFLERGKLNLKYLKPFYDFAYKKFGSSLSSESGYLSETAEESLKRKIAEDLEKELKKETVENAPKFEGQFSTVEEKINYNLQKAKDKKINSDEQEKMLSIE